MADNDTNATERKIIEDQIGKSDDASDDTPSTYLWQEFDGNRILVPSSTGKMWEARRNAAADVIKPFREAWAEALQYYNNDQSGMDKDTSPEIREQHNNDSENIVFSNISTLLPAIYSKNPTLAFNNKGDEEEDDFINRIKRVVEVLLNKKQAPGVNLKPKIRRTALLTLLTNQGWLKLDWINRTDSSDEAIDQLNKLSKELEDAEDEQTVKDIEAKLVGLSENISFLEPSGPKLRVLGSDQVLVDPMACEADLSDAGWAMYYEYMQTDYLNNRYLKKDEDGKYATRYKATHIIGNIDGADKDEFNNEYSVLSSNYDELEKYRAAYHTKVWWVWDRTTRRVYLFSDRDWTWPIWVWDDPYKLTRFFNLFGLKFFEGTGNLASYGEVTYYLNQQDAINQINREQASNRYRAFNTALYNKNLISADEIAKIRNAPAGGVDIPVDVPEGMKLSDIWMPAMVPSAAIREMYDKTQSYKAIDRISAVSDALRGSQFTANTTEDAVAVYQAAANSRTGEKIDCIEELVSDLAGAMAELAVQFMSEDDVAHLIGVERAKGWEQMSPMELNSKVEMSIVAGSSEKPTSERKKEVAVKLGGVLGQFVNSAPGATLKVMLKVLQRAFDEVVVTTEDWKQIEDEVANQATKGVSTQPNGGAAPNGKANPSQRSMGPSSGDTSDSSNPIAALVAALPPQAQQALQQAVANGAPAEQALPEIVAKLVEMVNAKAATG